MVKFLEEGHLYESIGPEKINWKSVTALTKLVEEKFDADTQAIKSSKNKKSKWFGKNPEEIKEIWKRTNTDSINLGNWYHKERERLICGLNSIEREGKDCKIINPIIEDSIKYAPEQKLEDNCIYPEHFVYLKSAGICGQSDLVEVRNGVVNVGDYKTNRNFTTTGYVNWRGEEKKLLYPLTHLSDCKLNIYALQLSIYMYIILKHNPQLKPGKLTLYHIQFKEIDRDSYDNPIYERDSNNEPVVEKVKQYVVPYLKDEVQMILNYLNELPE